MTYCVLAEAATSLPRPRLPPNGIAVVTAAHTADFDGNGVVDLDDFFLFAGQFGRRQT